MLLEVPKPRFDAASRVGGVVELEGILLKETHSFAASELGTISMESLVHDLNSSYQYMEETNAIRVLVKLGTRSEDADLESEEKLGFSIQARFELLYKLKIDPPPAEVRDFFFESFSSITAVFNVWPYWRELNDSVSRRLGLPHIAIPLIKFVPAGKKIGKTLSKKLKAPPGKRPGDSVVAKGRPGRKRVDR